MKRPRRQRRTLADQSRRAAGIRELIAAAEPTPPIDVDERQPYAWYEQRFAAAVKGLPERKPCLVEERARIADDLKRCLGIREKWVPALEVRTLKTATHEGFSIEYLRATSWPGVTATAHLYLPDGPRNEPLPAVFLGCGHGKGCKQSPGYQAMAFRLARMGAMVLVPDNIGQGEREPMGHRHVVEVFAHGLSLQGLIAMESIGWVRWLKKDRRVDVARIAAIGQSGGGTLTLMLAALCREDLTALSCSGYPSWFAFIAAKRKKHCHCNVLPGIVGELAMWHVLACFAPRPMYIFQGNRDRYFPHTTYFRETAEKLKDVYGRLGAGENFRGEVFAGAHSWDTARRRSLAAFLKGVLGLPGEVEHADPRIADPPGECLAEWPRDALSADDVAATLSGLPRARCRHLADVFPPASPEKGPRRKLTLQIFAQYEAFLRRRP